MLESLFVKGNGCACLIVFHMCLAASVTHLFLGLPTFLLRGSFGSIEFLLNVVCFAGLLLFCVSIRVYLFALLSWYATANGLTFFGILFAGVLCLIHSLALPYTSSLVLLLSMNVVFIFKIFRKPELEYLKFP